MDSKIIREVISQEFDLSEDEELENNFFDVSEYEEFSQFKIPVFLSVELLGYLAPPDGTMEQLSERLADISKMLYIACMQKEGGAIRYFKVSFLMINNKQETVDLMVKKAVNSDGEAPMLFVMLAD